ncbi:MAG: hemolysin family protein [Simkaniaceae bacterium]
MKVRVFRQSTDPRNRLIASLLDEPKDLLVTLLMLNVLVNILVQNVVAAIFGDFSLWIINVGVPLFITLIFGEVIPKSVALSSNVRISYKVAPSLKFIKKTLGPLRKVITEITSFISHYFFFFLRREKEVSIEELKLALRTSKEYGILHPDEAKLIRGYLNLEEDMVKEIMQPRQKILYYDINESLEKLEKIFVDKEVTRVPICEENLQQVHGILVSTDYFLNSEKLKTGKDLLPILKKPFFVPENSPAKQLLRNLFERNETLALVVDEYGSTSGLITLEDLYEMVIGQIADRRDEKSMYTQAGSDVIIASGKLELGEFEEIFDVHLESPSNMATIGGYLTEQMGEIPKSGSKWVTEDFLFHILSSDEKRIKRVYIRKLHGDLKKKGKKG